ncbi:hypothetical protein [Belliella pelovolcani]|nr:hypothetical protein [Belliella pelovolcani]
MLEGYKVRKLGWAGWELEDWKIGLIGLEVGWFEGLKVGRLESWVGLVGNWKIELIKLIGLLSYWELGIGGMD